MKLFQPLQRALAEQQYETPTPIQTETIPAAIDGKDILGCAQTGTGKTVAFGVPLLQLIDRTNPTTQAVILVPTRELGQQIQSNIAALAAHPSTIEYIGTLLYLIISTVDIAANIDPP